MGKRAHVTVGGGAVTEVAVAGDARTMAVLLGLRHAQWTSIGMLLIGVPGLYLLWRLTKRRVVSWTRREASPERGPEGGRQHRHRRLSGVETPGLMAARSRPHPTLRYATPINRRRARAASATASRRWIITP